MSIAVAGPGMLRFGKKKNEGSCGFFLVGMAVATGG